MGATSKQFCLPTHVITGLGCVSQLADVVARYGQCALLVCGRRALRSSGALERALRDLQLRRILTILHDCVQGEPTLAAARRRSIAVVDDP